MNFLKAMKLAEQYAACPECGSEHVGAGKGKLIIEEGSFFRSCKCGWSITVKGDEEQ